MSETPGPKKFGKPAPQAPTGALDLSDIKAVPSSPPGAPLTLPDDYQGAPAPRRRRARETKSRPLTMRITPSTFDRFNAFCDSEALSYSDALVRLLDMAERARD